MIIARSSGVPGAPVDATFITQTPSAILTNEQALSALATGILKSTTGTGVVSIATTSDIAALLPVVDETAIVYETGVPANTLTFNVTPFTAARVITWPDAAMTVAGLEVANVFTAQNTFTAGLLSYLAGITTNFFAGGAANGTHTGTVNVAIGANAFANLTSGTENVGIGRAALASLTSGYYNMAIGTDSLFSVTIQQNNVAIGRRSLFTTTGYNNVGIGSQALELLQNTNNNTAIGIQAGKNCVTGVANLFLGSFAGQNETGSNKLYISNSNTTTPLIYGEFDTPLMRVHGHFTALDTTATTNAVLNVATFGANVTGTGVGAAGFGPGVLFTGESSTTADTSMGRAYWYWNDATHATRKAYGALTAYDTAERTCIGWGANGTVALFGVYGKASAPVIQPATTGTTAGFTAGAGAAVLVDSTFDGNLGGSAYTIGDIVLALIQVGILAA